MTGGVTTTNDCVCEKDRVAMSVRDVSVRVCMCLCVHEACGRIARDATSVSLQRRRMHGLCTTRGHCIDVHRIIS